MKQCSACKTTYTDDSLRFCLADGTVLMAIQDEQPTVVSRRNDPIRLEIPSDKPPPSFPPVTQQNQAGPSWTKILLVFGFLGLLLLIAAGVAGAILYFNTTGRDSNINSKSPTPTASVSPSVDAEKQRLQDELANLQKRLDEQKNSNRAANVQPFPTQNSSGVVTARVNSPKDGFLALRSEPDADYGQRLAKIPHGTIVTIENCERSSVTIGGRTGRWCMVTYEDQTGYVFDAWLIY